jgi:hypothetical protein
MRHVRWRFPVAGLTVAPGHGLRQQGPCLPAGLYEELLRVLQRDQTPV